MFTRAGRFVVGLLAAAASLVPAPAGAVVPNTTITSGPNGIIATRSATFEFRASVRRATFQCKMDDTAWSPCESPKKYSRLRVGPHKFKVRARKNGVVDPTPAVRIFTVDAVKPTTTITSAPTDVTSGDIALVTYDHTPSFEFESNEPGTFKCRLTTETFQSCSSPFVPAEPLPDGSYTFEVKARDLAGNLDATPASLAFDILTPVTKDQFTAEHAAKMWFPDAIDLDVPAHCGEGGTTDCPGGTPLPPADQLGTTSTRSVVEHFSSNRYDLTVTSDVVTLEAIKFSHFGMDCEVTMTSANGNTPTWTVNGYMSFVPDQFGNLRVVLNDVFVSGVEDADWTVSGDFGCSGGFFPTSDTIANGYVATLKAHFEQVGRALCAAPGPDYLGPCPPSP